MPIDPSQQSDPNACRYSLPMDSCVGDGVGDPFAGGKSGGSKPPAGGYPGAGGDPYAGGKSVSPGWKNPRTVVSGPDLPNDYDTDDPNRS